MITREAAEQYANSTLGQTESQQRFAETIVSLYDQLDEANALKAENASLKRISIDLAWMARRYADGRRTYGPGLYNEHARALLGNGCRVGPNG